MESSASANVQATRDPQPLRRWALGSAYAFALLGSVSISLGQFMQAFMLGLAVIIIVQHWSALRGSPLLWVTAGFILYVTARGMVAALLERPDMATAQWEETGKWVRAGPLPILLVAIMLAVSGDWLRHSLGILAAWLTGYLVTLASGFSPTEFQAAIFDGLRYMENVNPWVDGLKLVAIVLALIALAPVWLGRIRAWELAWRLAAWLAIMTVAMVGIVIFGSRTIWVAALAGFTFLATALLWFGTREPLANHARALFAALVLGASAMALVTIASWDNIWDRWTDRDSHQVFQEILTTPPGKWIEELPNTAEAWRAAYVVAGLGYLRERPWLGYGPADPRYLRFEDPNLPPLLEGRQGHFHNGHLEILLRFGAIGYAFILLAVLLTFKEIRTQITEKGTPRLLSLFVAAFLVTLLVASFGSANLARFNMTHFYGIVLATIWGAALARRIDQRLPHLHPPPRDNPRSGPS